MVFDILCILYVYIFFINTRIVLHFLIYIINCLLSDIRINVTKFCVFKKKPIKFAVRSSVLSSHQIKIFTVKPTCLCLFLKVKDSGSLLFGKLKALVSLALVMFNTSTSRMSHFADVGLRGDTTIWE